MQLQTEERKMNQAALKIEHQSFAGFQKIVVAGSLVKPLSMAVLGVLLAVAAQAVDVMEMKCNNSFEEIKDDQPSGWIINRSFKPMGVMRMISENAKEGKSCIEIENMGGSQFALYVQEPQRVASGDQIKLSIYVKGHGRFRLLLYCYTGADAHWWGQNLPDKGPFIEVNSEEWELQKLEVTVPDVENVKGETITSVRPAIFVPASSGALQFDCFSGQIIRGEKSADGNGK